MESDVEFKMLKRPEYGCKPLDVRRNILTMNAAGTLTFCFAEAEIDIFVGSKRIYGCVNQRGLIRGPNGAQLLPYFQKGGIWYVVMVEQFRIALPGQTMECAGGEIEPGENARVTMAREFEEETGVKIDPAMIEIVFCELIQPSIMSARAFGGIVELKESELPENTLHGEEQSGGLAFPAIKPLKEILKLRKTDSCYFDLWGSRLLDEVAKKVGFLVENY